LACAYAAGVKAERKRASEIAKKIGGTEMCKYQRACLDVAEAIDQEPA